MVRSVQPREGTITTFRYVKHCLLQNSSNVFCVVRKPSTSERTLWESDVGLRRNKNVRISQGWSCLPQAEWIPAIKGPGCGGQILLRSVIKSFKHWNQASDSVSLDFHSLCLFTPQLFTEHLSLLVAIPDPGNPAVNKIPVALFSCSLQCKEKQKVKRIN